MFFWKKERDYRLIVGLGNPGDRYARTRHNMGFMCIDHYAAKYGIKVNKKQATSRIGFGEVLGHDVILAKPETFVNRSGVAVNRLRQKYVVRRDHLIVVHDDLDLASGKLRIRPVGGSSGHKGMTSVIDHLGRNDFARIRVGIGRPAGTHEATHAGDPDVVAYVLGEPPPEEEETFRGVIPRVGEAIDCILTEGLQAAMNVFNQRATEKEEP